MASKLTPPQPAHRDGVSAYAQVWAELGSLHIKAGAHDKATEVLLEGEASFPNNPAINTHLTELGLEGTGSGAARVAMGAAMAPRHYEDLGWAAQSSGDMAGALKHYQQVGRLVHATGQPNGEVVVQVGVGAWFARSRQAGEGSHTVACGTPGGACQSWGVGLCGRSTHAVRRGAPPVFNATISAVKLLARRRSTKGQIIYSVCWATLALRSAIWAVMPRQSGYSNECWSLFPRIPPPGRI